MTPGTIRDKWVRAVMDVRTKKHREGTLGDFIKLIHEETMLMNDPFWAFWKQVQRKVGHSVK